nr:5-(carboxyamino)imidazole ribonucleotide synthase [Hazenella coriacea]
MTNTPILPGLTIGVIGGGQLGRMVILEGRKLGLRFITLDPSPHCPGGQVSDRQIVAAYDDSQAMKELANACDVIIYEFENIDGAMVRRLEDVCAVPQGSRLLETTQHRLTEKKAIQASGVPVAPYRAITDRHEILNVMQEWNRSVVLKTTMGGYDGKGQWILQQEEDLQTLPDEMFTSGQEYILEQLIPFVREISVVVARSTTGEVSAFSPTVNLHRNHILHLSVAPAMIEQEVIQQAKELAIQIAEHLEVIGLVAVEMFMLPDGSLIVNELAPRPHNSGHYTFDACETSQFAQFLRAVLGLPLGSTQLHQTAVMVNLLGEHQNAFYSQFSQLSQEVKVHWYGKTEAKRGRKMGHLTFLTDSVSEALHLIEKTGIWEPLTLKELHEIGLETIK